MLQHDGSDEMTCTCFMFLKPTVRSHKLLALWKKNMIDKKSDKNQVREEQTQRVVVAGTRVRRFEVDQKPDTCAYMKTHRLERETDNHARACTFARDW